MVGALLRITASCEALILCETDPFHFISSTVPNLPALLHNGLNELGHKWAQVGRSEAELGIGMKQVRTSGYCPGGLSMNFLVEVHPEVTPKGYFGNVLP